MAKPTVNDIDREIGERLQKLRQAANISASTLAEAVGSTQQQISRYENGQNKISASQLYVLSRCLSVPLAWFFLDSETTVSVPSLISETSPPPYVRNSIAEETATLQAIWPRLNAGQRRAALKLLDSFLE
jgi:transcriptional regulator with XRE-family HTH domain